ncbi:MCE family protein [Nocardioides sp. WS12]|uniref:MCE family protein n=1 Tax=Nocardioides sp. WS12 TaxID=2486272 RepID=UPI001F240321|nr:MCE family protein [Nocardioides sp. WS12]
MRCVALVAVASSLLLAGCDYSGADSLPLPGGTTGDTYPVTVVFADATNLVAKETCRANDTVIGSVESVELDEDLAAEVVCRIRHDVELPANVTATIRETSLLGERFVSLDVPEGQAPAGVLKEGAILPAATTRVDPNAEMVLGAFSQVINGGGLSNVATITRELTAALKGSDLGATVDGLNSVVGPLNRNRSAITATLESVDRLSRKLASQRATIGDALDAIPEGLAVLDRQRPRLVKLLRQLQDLSATALPLIANAKANTVAGLKHLDPVLAQLVSAGDELSRTLERIATFPIPSNQLQAFKGDYGGIYIDFELDVDSLDALLRTAALPAGTPNPGVTPGATPGLPIEIPGLDLPGLGLDVLDPLLVGLLQRNAQ